MQQPRPLSQPPQDQVPVLPKLLNTLSMAAPTSQQPQTEPLSRLAKRGRPRKEPITPIQRPGGQNTHASSLPKTPTQPATSSTNQAAGPPPSPSQRASPLQQASSLQSPISSAIQQELQLQLARHLQQQHPSIQAKKTQKQPEQARDNDKLVALLAELNRKYKTIKPSCSTSPPPLSPNMNSEIVLQVSKSSPSISNIPSKAIAPAKAVATTAAAAATIASSPISISSGFSTPNTNSSFARSAASSPARRELMPVDNAKSAFKPASPVAKPPSTSIASATPQSTFSLVASSPKAAAASTAPSNAPTTNTTNASTSTVAAPSISASSWSETPSSSSAAAGKKRRALPWFAMSPFLRTKQELEVPEKKYAKREGYSSQRKSYPVVEPIEGYDAAIACMVNKKKNKKNSPSDVWSVSLSSEDEDENSD
ncbi:1-pyrroline-5-carboxylate dehydrogenase [Mucor velutinosus]|uniref:1-pyrroline-5-carboxylate dehydrogenase n=1 Tax=Mucor velutinosus TaxID=708070 RepID=A0AAN7HUX4_9FUNG|nr:1-pyrroline-5-carboxylate dehydrogenase [Mucor velutinosus]